jgi:hypothetical protein
MSWLRRSRASEAGTSEMVLSPATEFETPLGPTLDSRRVACAESRSLRPDRWDWLEVREYLVLRHDGTTVRYPVNGGDIAQARLRAALSQRPNDEVVVVTDDAYFRIGSSDRSLGRFSLSDPDVGSPERSAAN